MDVDTFAKLLFDKELAEKFIKECEAEGIVWKEK